MTDLTLCTTEEGASRIQLRAEGQQPGSACLVGCAAPCIFAGAKDRDRHGHGNRDRA